jgi:hypothetical protein
MQGVELLLAVVAWVPNLDLDQQLECGLIRMLLETLHHFHLSRGYSKRSVSRRINRRSAPKECIDIAPWLFCTKHGEGYFDEQTGQASGWDSMWQRFMARFLEETKITERFT